MTIQDQVSQLVDVVNDSWKCIALENNRSVHYVLSLHSVGRKYIKVTSKMNTDPGDRVGSVYMFVDKNTGECYKPASWKAPSKGVRGTVQNFIDNPHMCDPYGGFLYIR